ncbi:triose-phosphate isomerase [Bosea sp. (in: a-proteobacteria)]|uniref:triose-phosphate isomerase n=1 Tax=Bosea sp. (in: a-proteobacteria) TaxID=1871050 RepID=UPI002733E213|nr:triose-phosphate isomerase [Bosea sp. (in: a-proteobacteria)]MDP3410400.1 triose-phosphate isomerase [Bosea sp. (in: a-proteobacteria)]
MTRSIRPLVAGNWKMNGLKADLAISAEVAKGYDSELKASVDLAICPPASLLYVASAALVGSRIATGGQDCSPQASGAFTGEISAAMLADAGASFVIVGHSERRTLHGETSTLVKAKAQAAQKALLVPIVCVGETRDEREAGKALAVVKKQLRGSVPEGSGAATLVVAYEPVWAIGTGLTPTVADVADMHEAIRAELGRLLGKAAASGVRLLYGGSVKPSNAAELMSVAHVDGALVGGASLKAEEFLAIARACA